MSPGHRGAEHLTGAREGGVAKAITDREEEILKLVAEGYSSKEIAGLLVISVKTVERLELTRYAIRSGLIEP